MKNPKLAPPGAGLATIQTAVMRYLIVPMKSRKTSWDEDVFHFTRESQKILRVLDSQADMEKKVLVPPMMGLEDSSRYWSITETLEHLLIVGTSIKKCIEELSQEITPAGETKIANLKPKGNFSFQEGRIRFREFSENTASDLLKMEKRHSMAKYPHPWFGKLDAKQWCWLLGVHQGIHRKQIEVILKLQKA